MDYPEETVSFLCFMISKIHSCRRQNKELEQPISFRCKLLFSGLVFHGQIGDQGELGPVGSYGPEGVSGLPGRKGLPGFPGASLRGPKGECSCSI